MTQIRTVEGQTPAIILADRAAFERRALKRAKMMARLIFGSAMTDGSGDVSQTVQRLAFKGGTYPDAETDLGGMNEDCLASEIAAALIATRYMR
jgi:hypothetical protein